MASHIGRRKFLATLGSAAQQGERMRPPLPEAAN